MQKAKKAIQASGQLASAAQLADLVASELATIDAVGPGEDLHEAQDDDPDGFDPAVEYGDDPQFDDGDPSESSVVGNPWDRADRILSDGGAVLPDLAVRPGTLENKWEVVQLQPTNAIGAIVSSELQVMLHERTKLLPLAQAVVEQQFRYIASLDPDDLVDLKQTDLVGLLRDPDGRSRIDKSTVSRLLENSWIELPDSRVVRLDELVPDADRIRARRITSLLREHDRIDRSPKGFLKAAFLIAHAPSAKRRGAGVPTILSELQRRFGRRGNSEASVRRIMDKFGLPWRLDERRRSYEEGADWWSASF